MTSKRAVAVCTWRVMTGACVQCPGHAVVQFVGRVQPQHWRARAQVERAVGAVRRAPPRAVTRNDRSEPQRNVFVAVERRWAHVTGRTHALSDASTVCKQTTKSAL